MKKQQQRPSDPLPPHLQGSVSSLRDAAKDLVLEAARAWKEEKGSGRTERVLASALEVLAASEAVLGEVLELGPVDGEPVAPGPNGRARH